MQGLLRFAVAAALLAPLASASPTVTLIVPSDPTAPPDGTLSLWAYAGPDGDPWRCGEAGGAGVLVADLGSGQPPVETFLTRLDVEACVAV